MDEKLLTAVFDQIFDSAEGLLGDDGPDEEACMDLAKAIVKEVEDHNSNDS